MGMNMGMRGKDLRNFLMVADRFNVIILVRQTNEDSLQYIGAPGFYPKPAVVKAKTASQNPPAVTRFVGGRKNLKSYQVAGLVAHPGFQPNAHSGAKAAGAQKYWKDTMESLAPTLIQTHVDLARPDSWSLWGIERKAANGSEWVWRVDINPESDHFGCLQLRNRQVPWSYIHGDYDLKDVIVIGNEKENLRFEGKIDGVKNYTPILKGLEFRTIQRELNGLMGNDMIQHGAEAQFAWHGDEPVVVASPGWKHQTLLSAETVQAWYDDLNRKVLAATGKDYLRDRSRMFHFGPQGMFKPGQYPASSWGT